MIIAGVEFHDLPLVGIELSLNAKEVILTVQPWDEKSNDHYLGKVHFKEVSKLDMDLLKIDDLTDMEIASMDVIDNGARKKIEITILNGWSMPSTNLIFECGSVHYSWQSSK
ncbi:MAG: hypothetical protein JWO03_2593 [Bacteroidetes bacterium]|nr:hypothetical protein [Bacteroidota bacterium]